MTRTNAARSDLLNLGRGPDGTQAQTSPLALQRLRQHAQLATGLGFLVSAASREHGRDLAELDALGATSRASQPARLLAEEET